MPFELLMPVLVVASYATLMVIEHKFPGSPYPQRRLWRLRGWGFLVLNGVISVLVPLVIPLHWLESVRLLDASGLSPLPGALLGYLVVSLLAYLWHRAAHRSDRLWRWFHQLHHAPVRVDLGGATIFHPFESVVYIVLTAVGTASILGLSPEATSMTIFIAQLWGLLVHTNIRTPWWIGYVVQRPEAHGLHHHRRVTPCNYGDFPLWDILFGTFENPRAFSREPMGFAGGNDEAYGAMLAGRDVSQPAIAGRH